MKNPLSRLLTRTGHALIRAAGPATTRPTDPWIVPAQQSRWISAGVSYYTPQQVENVFKAALAGDLVSQWEMFDLMEATWPELSQCLNELKDSVCGQPFEVEAWKPKNGEASPEAERRAALVEELLWNMKPEPTRDENDLEDTIRDLLDARGKGISVLEVDWAPVTTSVGPAMGPRATRWVHPSWYGYPNATGELMLRSGASQLTQANYGPGQYLPFPPHKFIIGIAKNKTGHPLGSAMLHVLGFWWAAFNFTADSFFDLSQVFGQPIRWANYDASMSAGDKAKLKAMLENMGRSAWGMFPEGVTLELKEAMKSSADNPQKVLLDTANKVCRLLILRQTLTSDAGDSGTRALGEVHQQTKAGVELACAKWTYKNLQQLVRSICVLNFGDDRECPYLVPRTQREDPKQLAETLATAKTAGLEPVETELAEIGERLGFEVQRVAAPPALPFGGGGFGGGASVPASRPMEQEEDDDLEPEPKIQASQSGMATRLGVPVAWLNPLREQLAQIEAKVSDESLSEADLTEFLDRAVARLPELFNDLDVDELAELLAAGMGGAVLNEVRRGMKAKLADGKNQTT
jgi:phage gp29-like protein